MPSIVLNRREKIGSQILLQSSGLNNTGPENTWIHYFTIQDIAVVTKRMEETGRKSEIECSSKFK
jgi:hypothetical protein